MADFVEADGEVHVMNPGLAEFTLCGDAFDLDAVEAGYAQKPTRKRRVTCDRSSWACAAFRCPAPSTREADVGKLTLTIREFVDVCVAAFVSKHGSEALPCWRCGGHRRVEVYDISDEYAAPCPVCIGPEAYLKKLLLRSGHYSQKDVDYAYQRDPALTGEPG